MGLFKKYYFVITINFILFLILLLTGCQKTQKPASDVTVDGSNITGTNAPDANGQYYDSTDVYGKGYYDYQDTLDTFHDGYNIPGIVFIKFKISTNGKKITILSTGIQ